jgi:thiol-disulfide isomerase/thioredoxin
MKKILLLAACAVALLYSDTLQAQQKAQKIPQTTPAVKKDSLLPYQKYPKMPAFKILEMDSTTTFNTYDIPSGKPTVIIFFGPDCEHCKHLTETLLAGWDSLSNIQFYMVSFANIGPIRNFYNKFNLQDHKNIKVVGKDAEFFFSSFYGARAVPYLAVYDKHKKFVRKFEGSATVKELYDATRK